VCIRGRGFGRDRGPSPVGIGGVGWRPRFASRLKAVALWAAAAVSAAAAGALLVGAREGRESPARRAPPTFYSRCRAVTAGAATVGGDCGGGSSSSSSSSSSSNNNSSTTTSSSSSSSDNSSSSGGDGGGGGGAGRGAAWAMATAAGAAVYAAPLRAVRATGLRQGLGAPACGEAAVARSPGDTRQPGDAKRPGKAGWQGAEKRPGAGHPSEPRAKRWNRGAATGSYKSLRTYLNAK